MTQLQKTHADKIRISQEFQAAKGQEIEDFRDYWLTKSDQAHQAYGNFTQVMRGSVQISFAKIQELEELCLFLSQYDYVLFEKSKVLSVQGDVLEAVQDRLNNAVNWLAFARQSLKTIRNWTVPMNR